ncbi:MAG: hypothetical protein UY39_C0001G0014 [Candidatus Kaiserbacteria bacterium GW2011_GWC2_49_12]|uniref:Uncharacterized protein n=3 Tax=Candidatus Kaiseribacteriota TaxID=1752734 RepID=A0A0G1WH30_9BACT|nr:MAG: hypothetical protein UY39_C0001G0014 [Candidatus Kaiserbacteria bacterium GW2011_GWC2_49_12]KKW18076.1 MAG: hypothetical protein UY57_C0002G0017 [Candidatus Kaiserbacteria bacterium GW2011_GWB1_50_17]KKW18569.1 MAG: hypothetical protein UY59_C0003G0017 [Candidatus Kaiserbacteria bacterium GW2011_GWA1_50_28]HCM43478.1 hypothetical protein [Candidatus Kaiserbacteria bacterium]
MTGILFPAGHGIVRKQLGVQPISIALVGDLLVVSCYFQPALLVATVSHTPEGVWLRDVRKIQGALMPDGTSKRFFPDVLQPIDANRMQACLIFSSTHFGLFRNEERVVHHVEQRGERWHYEGAESLPESSLDWVFSAMRDADGTIATIECDKALEQWSLCTYGKRGPTIHGVAPWTYGFAQLPNGAYVTICQHRADAPGIYVGDKRINADVSGTGIALLEDGAKGALVTSYGQDVPGPLWGVPGELIYVPPEGLRL